MIHDENHVLTDDELVIVRIFSGRQNMYVYTYGMNIFVDFMYYVRGDHFFKVSQKDSLNVVIHPSIYCDNHDTCWIQMFLD